jgi:hypothetical protein
MKTTSMPLLLASIATFAMSVTGYSQSPPNVPVRRRMSPLRLSWRDAAMLAAILLPCAAIASPPVVKPSSSFNSQSVFAGASATFTITATGDASLVYQLRQDGTDLPGQTNKTLRIGTTQPPNEGGYDVIVACSDVEKRMSAMGRSLAYDGAQVWRFQTDWQHGISGGIRARPTRGSAGVVGQFVASQRPRSILGEWSDSSWWSITSRTRL